MFNLVLPSLAAYIAESGNKSLRIRKENKKCNETAQNYSDKALSLPLAIGARFTEFYRVLLGFPVHQVCANEHANKFSLRIFKQSSGWDKYALEKSFLAAHFDWRLSWKGNLSTSQTYEKKTNEFYADWNRARLRSSANGMLPPRVPFFSFNPWTKSIQQVMTEFLMDDDGPVDRRADSPQKIQGKVVVESRHHGDRSTFFLFQESRRFSAEKRVPPLVPRPISPNLTWFSYRVSQHGPSDGAPVDSQ